MDIYEQLWNAFSDIFFDELPHKYTDSYGTNYTSVTTFVGQLEQEKDWDEIAKKAIKSAETAVKQGKEPKHPEYLGKTVEELRAMWKASGDYACVLGTMVHATLEYAWQNKQFYPDKRLFEQYSGMEEDYKYRKEKCDHIMKLLRERYIPIKNETIVYDREWRLCGTIDFLAYNKKKKCVSILDWKTNKSWEFTNRYQKLNAPFNFLDDCNINHYELQLNTYKAILEKHTDIKVGEMRLVQIPNSNKSLIETHECRDLQETLIPYLNGRIEKKEK